MANNTVEAEIVRLVQEIAKDEKNVRFHREESMLRYSEQSRAKEAETAKMYEESLERKMRLLEILKR